MLSVIVPAHDEADWIDACLGALLAQTVAPKTLGGLEVLVVANGCSDDTAVRARAHVPAARARGIELRVIELAEGSKHGALNRGDAEAGGEMRAYLDADVVLGPAMLERVAGALATDRPVYASGRLEVAPARSTVTRLYGRFWSRLPFVAEGVPGAGFYAVNAAGRARWGTFPAIISDDTYARLHFAPEERIGVDAAFTWPMVEGFSRLVRVRRRQDAGVREVARHFPDLMANEGKRPMGAGEVLRRALADPAGFAVYAAVALAVRLGDRGSLDWTRGR